MPKQKKIQAPTQTPKGKIEQDFISAFLNLDIGQAVLAGQAYKKHLEDEHRKKEDHSGLAIHAFEPWDFIFSCIPLKTIQEKPHFIGEAIKSLERNIFKDSRIVPARVAFEVLVDSVDGDGMPNSLFYEMAKNEQHLFSYTQEADPEAIGPDQDYDSCALFLKLGSMGKKIFKNYQETDFQNKMHMFYYDTYLGGEKHDVLIHNFFMRQINDPEFYIKTKCQFEGQYFPVLLKTYFMEVLSNPYLNELIWGSGIRGHSTEICQVLEQYLGEACTKKPSSILTSHICAKFKKAIHRKVAVIDADLALDEAGKAKVTSLLDKMELRAAVSKIRKANEKLKQQVKPTSKPLTL